MQKQLKAVYLYQRQTIIKGSIYLYQRQTIKGCMYIYINGKVDSTAKQTRKMMHAKPTTVKVIKAYFEKGKQFFDSFGA